MSKEYVIGLDVGTTSVKACLFNKNGSLISVTEEMITSYYPQQGWAEQDAVQIEASAKAAIKDMLGKAGIASDELIAISFSTAMHSLLIVDEDGVPQTPAMIWSDGRGTTQADGIEESLKRKLYALTGTPVHPMTPFVKLLWMKETEYPLYKDAAYLMSIKEYLLYSWFGERIIDYSMASATGLFNPATLDWEPQLLELAGVSKEQLSRIVPPTTLLNAIKPEIADQMGVPSELPFVIGAADGQLANLGIGALLPGEAAVSVGTSGAIRQFTDRVTLSDKQETFCYAFSKDQYIVGGATNNGGIVIQWLKELVNDDRKFEQFLAEAEDVEPGAEGLLFLPYVNGERAPLWNQRARGNFFGLTVTHRQPHLVRAVLEGITFNLYQIGRALEEQSGPPRKLYVNGGLSRSPLWLQMMADVFEAEIYVSENHHGAAWGAAWTALVALGQAPNFEAVKHNIPLVDPVLPNKESSARYKEIYAKYSRLAQSVAEFF